jgi:muconate cycloisomerase
MIDTIAKIEIFPVTIPLKKPMYMNDRCLKTAENVIVRLELSSGIVGWGETASAPRMTGELQSTIKLVIESVFVKILVGQNISDYKTLLLKINKSIYANPGAKSAIEIALLDAYSKSQNTSVANILGTVKRDTFNSIHILGNKSWKENIDEAMSSTASWFKIKVASKDIDEDIQGTIELRKQLGDSAIICADANAGLTLDQTICFIEGTTDSNLKFLEQPVSSVDDMALIQRLSTNLCMDEFVFDINDLYEIKRLNAARGINLKNIKLGGPLSVVECANLCSQLGLLINISGKVSETGIATAALLHCAAVVPNVSWGVSVTNNYLEADITKDPVGSLLPNGIGLGIDVDEYFLKTYKVIL